MPDGGPGQSDGAGKGTEADRLLIMMRGHTASGKTTLSRWLASNTNLVHISQSERKRALVAGYSADDSLREDLRERGYAIALADAIDCIGSGSIPIIDASHHKQSRRQRVYAGAAMVGAAVVLIDCLCPNQAEVRRRINSRRGVPKTADNQADSMEIYHHILDTEDPFLAAEVPDGLPLAYVRIDTSENRIDSFEQFGVKSRLDAALTLIHSSISKYLRDRQ